MQYKIKEIELKDETLNTLVEITYDDNTTEDVTISHFRTETKEKIIENIEQRCLSEQTRKDYTEKNEILAVELENLVGEIVVI